MVLQQDSRPIQVAVIIPYFQRERGILRRCLQSVLSQEIAFPLVIRIFVVDDCSPAPAVVEVEDLDVENFFEITVLRRSNGGPAAARNTGLDHLGSQVDYVAFLDSDDVWEPYHLRYALSALKQGYDVFFSDFYHPGQTVTAFNRAGRITVSQHPIVDNYEPLHAFTGDMVVQITTGNIIGTSTVVYAFRKYRDIRFREDLVNAGEDYFFWLELSLRKTRFSFSSRPTCRYGYGVNIFSGATWGTREALDRLQYEILYQKKMLSELPLPPQSRRAVSRGLWDKRREFLANFAHLLRADKCKPIRLLHQIRSDPMMMAVIPSWLWSMMIYILSRE